MRSVRSWYGSVDWAKHTTVIAAVVAAAGLGVTAWGTLVTARVAEDQLAQSKVASEERAKRQASRITWWSQLQKGEYAAVIANRSLDPVRVILAVRYGDTDSWGKYGAIRMHELPPCSRVVIPRSKLSEGPSRRGTRYVHSLVVTELRFTDTYGQSWTRRADGTLRRGWGVELDSAFVTLGDAQQWVQDTVSKSTPLEECGAES